MDAILKTLKQAAAFAGEVAAETLWPTRCALCDAPGTVLCERCMRGLPYLDWWRACHRCGAPFGAVQCSSCNSLMLARIGREELPFAACASATMFTGATGQIVRVYKDQGEQRLAAVLAGLMARVVSPGWKYEAITFVPATLAAYRRRGFDHAELIARELASRIGAPCEPCLHRPSTCDQRSLSASQRLANLQGRFRPMPDTSRFRSVLVVDDVMTTGATLCAASDALLAAGVAEVRAITFTRV